MVRILTRIIRDPGELHALAEDWWDLWHRSPTATRFQSPAWLLPWCRAFAPGELMTVAAECLGKLVGLAPIYREDGSLGRRLLPLGISLSDYHDVLIDPGHIDDAWPAMIQRVFGTEHWEAWEWEELAPDDTALSLPLRSHGRSQLSNQSACPVLTFTGASLPECLPKRQRNALHLARNRAKRRGPLAGR